MLVQDTSEVHKTAISEKKQNEILGTHNKMGIRNGKHVKVILIADEQYLRDQLSKNTLTNTLEEILKNYGHQTQHNNENNT